MGSSSSKTLSFRIMLTSLIVLSTATILNLFIPSVLAFAVNDIPVLYSTILSWLRPPYLYVIINTIIITIAATSRFHHSNHKVQSQPLDHLPPVTVPPVIVYEAVNTVPEVLPVVYELEHPVIDDKEVVVVNESEVTRSTWQSPVEKKVQTEFVFPVREKPLASSRFAGQRKLTAKFNPEGVRSLRVSKPKKHETLESTWKTITDGRHIPLNRHLKKSDTFENHNQHEPKLDYNAMKKLETFNDRTDRVLASRKLRKEGSPSQDELNRRVEAFIKKFNDEMRLQRQESLQRYMDMMNRSAE
ncbi:hypothetical protein CTI12_AA402100 [Artemisia annua]|uniref:DUF4408 domain-containing protein n=1 Tax=Artemisia annua TaxID=35608 RepID=A0A2U1MAH6_ARTAN|nr:hypothetical protein CTI12_AA402100 [Artemisia annua]